MSLTDRLLARIEVLAVDLSDIKRLCRLKEEEVYDLKKGLAEKLTQTCVLGDMLASLKSELSCVREDHEYSKTLITSLRQTADNLRAELRLHKAKNYAGMSDADVARRIVGDNPDPGEKIHNIKQLRDVTDLGINEAKDLIEQVRWARSSV